MKNLRMQEKLEEADAVDVNKIGRPHPDMPGVWILNTFIEDVDYCDAANESWIWSIGRHRVTGEIHASTSNQFYQNPDYECLWLR